MKMRQRLRVGRGCGLRSLRCTGNRTECIRDYLYSGALGGKYYMAISKAEVFDQIYCTSGAVANLILGIKSANVNNLCNHIIRARAHAHLKIPGTETQPG